MALALKLNGSTTASIPGSPSNGDTITMDNGVVRISFSYNDHVSGLWEFDKIEAWDGAAWQVGLYGRDRIRLIVAGAEKVGTDVLTLITNTASEITLKLAWSSAVAQGGVNWNAEATFTMRDTHNFVEVNPSFHGSGNFTGTVDLVGFGCYLSPGNEQQAFKLFNYAAAPDNNQFSTPLFYKHNNYKVDRQFAKPNSSGTVGNLQQRGYGFGAALLKPNNVLTQVYYDPASFKTLIETLVGYTTFVFAWKWYVNWWKGVENKYSSIHDDTMNCIAPGLSAVDPLTARTYTVKLWMTAQIAPNTKDHTILKLFNEFAFAGPSKMNVTAGPITLAQLAAVVEPTLASNYTTYFDNTKGFQIYIGDNNQYVSFGTALAIQAALRLYRYTGTADYLTEATRCKDILLNFWRITSGGQKGAFRKLYNTSATAYRCQEAGHNGAGDQPHIATYNQAECMWSLMEYQSVNPLSPVATALDEACDYLVSTMMRSGGWVTDMNSSGVATATNPNAGASLPGSASALLAALMLEWSYTNSGHANALTWRQKANQTLQYMYEYESTPHGAYEYGEGQVGLSSHALRMLIAGFARAFRVTGNLLYKERAMFWMEMAIAQCKKSDVVFNTVDSANQDIHVGGLLCTLDWAGQVGPEAMSIMHTMMTDGLTFHDDIKKHILYYLYAQRHHNLFGMRDAATYTNPSAYGYSFISPGTTASSAAGIDNTRMGFHAASAALWLLSLYYLARSSNDSLLCVTLEAGMVKGAGDRRTIIVYNPTGSTQTANITVKNPSSTAARGVTCNVGGVLTGSAPYYTVSGSDIVIPISLTSDQIATIKVV